ncbi:hypothetical protein [Sphingobium terrigena]|uniref:hypothetical protein n=1 Tax=Sphingobium terrigena TaxID=2304063 RepID=UPI0011C41910|nr:hypothetical protein [Sphingobium terrigena]
MIPVDPRLADIVGIDDAALQIVRALLGGCRELSHFLPDAADIVGVCGAGRQERQTQYGHEAAPGRDG